MLNKIIHFSLHNLSLIHIFTCAVPKFLNSATCAPRPRRLPKASAISIPLPTTCLLYTSIKISRDADILIDDAANTSEIIEQVKTKVKKRKIGDVCRFVYDRAMPQDFLD